MPRVTIIQLADELLAHAKNVVTDAVKVYTPDQLLDMESLVKPPAVAVSYIGRARVVGNGLENRGKAVTIRFGLYVLGATVPCKAADGTTATESILAALDNLKDEIVDTDSLTGHKWIFHSDVPFNFKKKDGTVLMGYVQVWETVQL